MAEPPGHGYEPGAGEVVGKRIARVALLEVLADARVEQSGRLGVRDGGRRHIQPDGAHGVRAPMGRPEFLSLDEAIAEVVVDGQVVALEGFTHLIPFAAGHEIVRQGRREQVGTPHGRCTVGVRCRQRSSDLRDREGR